MLEEILKTGVNQAVKRVSRYGIKCDVKSHWRVKHSRLILNKEKMELPEIIQEAVNHFLG